MNEITAEDLVQLQKQQEKYLLLDVREPFEHNICNIGGKLIPMGELADRIAELDSQQHIIIYCKHGSRGLRAMAFLASQGFDHVSNLAGGIMAWIERIDPTLAKY